MGAMARMRRLRVGDSVSASFAGKRWRARVIEDCGNIGVGGRQLVRVRFSIWDQGEPIEMEIPAEEARLLAARARKAG